MPPALVQLRVYEYVPAELNTPVDMVPLVTLPPFHPAFAGALLPVQEVGVFVLLHVKLALLPAVTAIGLTDNDTTGAGGTVTVRATLRALPVPPALVQLKE